MGDVTRLPLFPLRTVLFPGGRLDLRVFERRYLDMVRECARHDGSFGICLILDGNEVGAPSATAAIGTQARIVDFYTRTDGLLGLTVEGGRRFHVEQTRVRDSGLIMADVQWLPADLHAVVPAQHGLLARLLEHLLEKSGQLPVDARQLDDAAWVGWRLAEMLPLRSCDQQHLLQLGEASDRLDALAGWLPHLASPE